MMKGNVFMKLSLLLLLFVQTLFAVEIGELNIAVVWNINTHNTATPIGWNVGDAEGRAPEIAKAQMKMLFSSFSSKITFDSQDPLDVADIPDTMTTSNGIPSGTYQGELKNVRIYSWYSISADNPLSLDRIKADFGGVKPNAIVYVNGGAEWGYDETTGSDGGLYKLLQDAADDEIGIMTIGDASVTDAKNIDPSKTKFPVMGVQKTYRFKAFIGDTIREFDFMSDNNTTDWDVADTVVLEGDRENYTWFAIRRVNDKKEIYRWEKENAGAATGKVTKDPSFLPTTGTNGYGETPVPDVLHSYGEWSINAKAVEVVDIDYYAPEMADGIYNNHDVVLVSRNNSVYVSNVTWSEKLWANNTIIASPGEELPEVTNYGSMNGNKFIFDKDYIREVPNSDDSNIKDSILIIKAGTEVEAGAEKEDKHYLYTYRAGGYKNLRIDLMDSEQIFNEVFPTLKGNSVSSLIYRPWTVNGRIQADADIWAVNEKLDLKSFDVIASEGFDNSAYYTAYLGDQRAGTKGTPHFVKPPASRGEFDSSAAVMRLDSVGYDSNGKLYHAISAIQNNHRRMVMLGFQPTYIKDYNVVNDLLSDATKWIGVDDYKLPAPKIIPIYEGNELLPADGQKVFTDIDSVRFDIDFSKNGNTLKSAAFKLVITVEYDGVSQKVEKVFDASNRKELETHTIELSKLISISNSNVDASTIKVSAICEPNVAKAPFDNSDNIAANLTIRRLAITCNVADSTEFIGEVDVTFTSDKDVHDDNLLSDPTIRESETNTSVTGTVLTLKINTNNETVLKGKATHPKYLDSEELLRRVIKTDVTLPKPVITPDTDSCAKLQEYFFFRDTSFMVELSSYPGGVDTVRSEDYNINYSYNNKHNYVNDQIDDTGFIAITLAKVQEMIDNDETKFWVNAETVPQDPNGAWKPSGGVSESYEFRTLSIAYKFLTAVTADGKVDITVDSVEMKVTLVDSTNGWNKELDSLGVVTYSYKEKNGNEVTFEVASGTVVKVPTGAVIRVLGRRPGYWSNSATFPLVEGTFVEFPDSTAFGDSLKVKITSSVNPFKVTVITVDKDTVVDTTVNGYVKEFTLTDALLNDLVSLDTADLVVNVVVDSVWEDGKLIVEGVDTSMTYTHRRLPEVVASPTGSGSNTGRYLFDNTDGVVALSLDDPISESSDYTIHNWLNGVKKTDVTKSGGTTVIPLDDVVALIDAKKTGIELTAQAIANNPHGPNSWMNGKEMEKETFEFRSLAVKITRVDSETGTDFMDSLTFRVEAIDTVDGGRIITGDNIITINGNQVMNSPSEITITNDTMFIAQAKRRGWIDSQNTDSTTFIRKVDLSGGAAYFDGDGDGVIDSGWINVDVNIKPLTVECSDPFSDTVFVIDSSAVTFDPAESRYVFSIEGFAFGTGFDDSAFISLTGVNYNASTDVVDSVAPVLLRGKVVSSEDNKTELDYLYVEFSEPMDEGSLKNESPFVLTYRNDAHIPVIASTPEYVSSGDETGMYRFKISGWGDEITYPVDSSYLHINDTAGVKDVDGAEQLVEKNKKVLLDIKPAPVELDMVWFWKNAGVDLTKGEGLRQVSGSPMSPYVAEDSVAVVMLLDPTTALGENQAEFFEVNITIVDQLGNIVASGKSGSGAVLLESNLTSNPAIFNIKEADGTEIKDVLGIAVFWSAQNMVGRRVSGGTYKVLIQTEWPGEVKSEVTSLIKVGSNDDTKAFSN